MSLSNRLVVLGLDSLPPELVIRLAQDGTMPFVAELLERGSFGPLHSVTPANTGSGWNSAWTGHVPAKHGYFHFWQYVFEDDSVGFGTSENLNVPTLWEMFNANGLRTIVINSPMQFPATKLDGVMVSGFMAPSLRPGCTYPEEFRDELSQKIPDYLFDVHMKKSGDDDKIFKSNIESVRTVFRQRVKAAELAASRGQWDVLIVVFKSIDNILHYTWDYVFDAKSFPERHKLIRQIFYELDDACRKLAELAGYPNVNLLLCSDHGQGPVKSHLFINRLFINWKVLVPQMKLGRFFDKIKISFNKRIGGGRNKKKPTTNVGTKMRIKWNESKVAMITEGCIYLNVKGRQPNGVISPEQYYNIRDQIVSKLKSLKDQTDDKPLLQIVDCPATASPKSRGGRQSSIPDIIIEPADGVKLRDTTKPGPVWQCGRPNELQACHRVDGFVLAAGPAFAKDCCIEGNLYDITPTALAAYGLPIPREIEGKPISKSLLDESKIKYATEQAYTTRKNSSFSQPSYDSKEAELIEQQLRDLGYTD